MDVITYISPAGETIAICLECERRLRDRWPRDSRGQEYCRVSHGLHQGKCDAHEARAK